MDDRYEGGAGGQEQGIWPLYVGLFLVLLSFFIMLAGLSKDDAGRTSAVVESPRPTFRPQPAGRQSDEPVYSESDTALDRLGGELAGLLRMPLVERLGRGQELRVTFPASALFPANSADDLRHVEYPARSETTGRQQKSPRVPAGRSLRRASPTHRTPATNRQLAGPALDLDYLTALLSAALATDRLLHETSIERTDDRLVIRLPSDLLFAPGETMIADEARPSLDVLARALENFGNPLAILGHAGARCWPSTARPRPSP
jgi:flagellar motor protein MotB